MFCKTVSGLMLISVCNLAAAAETSVAVATNFLAPMKQLAQTFEQETGHKLKLSFASSGKLFAQIRHGAPYDLFFSADAEKPQRLVEAGSASAEYHFTYAIGRLALWSNKHHESPLPPEQIKLGDYRKLAIANPKHAPYGRAAKETLMTLKLYEQVRTKLVVGENIGQAYQFIGSGNAELGFVALSQLKQGKNKSHASSYWVVPEQMHQPIVQDAVLLKRGSSNAAAHEFLRFIRSDQAKTVLEAYGYRVPTPNDGQG